MLGNCFCLGNFVFIFGWLKLFCIVIMMDCFLKCRVWVLRIVFFRFWNFFWIIFCCWFCSFCSNICLVWMVVMCLKFFCFGVIFSIILFFSWVFLVIFSIFLREICWLEFFIFFIICLVESIWKFFFFVFNFILKLLKYFLGNWCFINCDCWKCL